MTRQEQDRIAGLQASVNTLIQMSTDRDHSIATLASDMSDLKRDVQEMRPTVHAVADTLTFAKVGRRLVIGMAAIGAAGSAALAWVFGNMEFLRKLFLLK